jgi:hypothetical protein
MVKVYLLISLVPQLEIVTTGLISSSNFILSQGQALQGVDKL